MTWRRIGSFGSSGSIRLAKYGVMSTRNLSSAVRPACSSSVRFRTAATSSSVLIRLLSCQRQSFHFSSGTSSQSGARRLRAGMPSGPSASAGSRGLTHARVERGHAVGRGGRAGGGVDLLGGVNSRLTRTPLAGAQCIKSMHSASPRIIARGSRGFQPNVGGRLPGPRPRALRQARRPDVDPAFDSSSRISEPEERVLLVRQVLPVGDEEQRLRPEIDPDHVRAAPRQDLRGRGRVRPGDPDPDRGAEARAASTAAVERRPSRRRPARASRRAGPADPAGSGPTIAFQRSRCVPCVQARKFGSIENAITRPSPTASSTRNEVPASVSTPIARPDVANAASPARRVRADGRAEAGLHQVGRPGT